MNDALTLFGTASLPAPRERFEVAGVSFSYEAGALRHLKLNGVEAIRGIAFLVRDRDWGTLEPVITDKKIDQSKGHLTIAYHARYTSHGATLDVDIRISASAGGLTMSASGHATGAFETNRAGFTVLHPIKGVAGASVQVTHSDGSVEDSVFPDLIAPWQPFMDITALTHQAGELLVSCRLEGDTFEMEDQRQWGDASFKTYNRPLALPWPYEIADGATLAQSVNLTWTQSPTLAFVRPQKTLPPARFPQMALVITPQDALRLADRRDDLEVIRPQRLLCHLDATLGDVEQQIEAFAQAQMVCFQTHFDLEYICDCSDDPEADLVELSAYIDFARFTPDSVMICPSVDRQSTPPGSDWPACPPLEEIHKLAGQIFPDTPHGGGMVSLFTELNRKRPPVDVLDFVSHGLCPIVHAADDLSVMETLEAVPHITRSMRAIIGDKPYRIGPSTIAMRQNPYGRRTMANPNRERLCMTDDDPRHHAQFGAAYVIGLATALASANIEVWTPAALYGVRGVIGMGKAYPLATPLRTLASLAGKRLYRAEIKDGIAYLEVGAVLLCANLTPQSNGLLPPYGWNLTQRE